MNGQVVISLVEVVGQFPEIVTGKVFQKGCTDDTGEKRNITLSHFQQQESFKRRFLTRL